MRVRRYACAAMLVALVSGIGCESETVTSPTPTPSPVTETWTGTIAPGGTASRSLTTSQAGVITVTLTSSDAPLGMGIGVPRTANNGCRLTTSQSVAGGDSLSLPADAGTYCVQLYDESAVVKQAGFVVQIVYP